MWKIEDAERWPEWKKKNVGGAGLSKFSSKAQAGGFNKMSIVLLLGSKREKLHCLFFARQLRHWGGNVQKKEREKYTLASCGNSKGRNAAT